MFSMLFLFANVCLAEESSSAASEDANDTSETTESNASSEQPTDSDAKSSEESDDSEATDETAKPSIEINPEEAEELGTISQKEFKDYQPITKRLPQDPYLHVDFTAYTLEWGEFQTGINNLQIGVLPRTQVGVRPLMLGLGLPNASLKANVARFKAFDFALTGSFIRLPTESFSAQYSGGGAMFSIRAADPFTLHIGAQYASVSADGIPDLDTINPLLIAVTGTDVDAVRDQIAENSSLSVNSQNLNLKLAADYRFNRRDSLIFQFQGLIWSNSSSEVELDSEQIPPILGLDELLNREHEGFVSPAEAYITSLAWQWSFKRSYLRVGGGISTIPGAWITQSIDYSWQFGGATRRNEQRIRSGWRTNRRALEKGADQN